MSLQTDCLRMLPLDAKMVESYYVGSPREDSAYDRLIRMFCLSHERLRAELAGAESLLDEGASKIARLEAQVRQQQREIMELRTELARSVVE